MDMLLVSSEININRLTLNLGEIIKFNKLKDYIKFGVRGVRFSRLVVFS